MNREELDDFFARADDVLTDWHPGADAMVARVPSVDVDTLPPRIDSYYDQTCPITTEQLEALSRAGAAAAEGLRNMARQWQVMAERFSQLRIPAAPVTQFRGLRPSLTILDEMATESPADRALRLRRDRNTGPAPRRGLDGRSTRHARTV